LNYLAHGRAHKAAGYAAARPDGQKRATLIFRFQVSRTTIELWGGFEEFLIISVF